MTCTWLARNRFLYFHGLCFLRYTLLDIRITLSLSLFALDEEDFVFSQFFWLLSHQLPLRSRKRCKTISRAEKGVLTKNLLKCFQILFSCYLFQDGNLTGEAHCKPVLFQVEEIINTMNTFSTIIRWPQELSVNLNCSWRLLFPRVTKFN